MKLKYLMVLIIGLLLISSVAIAAENKYPQITEQVCSGCNPCSGGLVCISFPGIGPRCAQTDPCSYYCPAETKCNIAMPMMAQICNDGTTAGAVAILKCQCVGPDCPTPDEGGTTISIDVKTRKIIIGDGTHNVSIRKDEPSPSVTPGFTGGSSADEDGGSEVKSTPGSIGTVIIDDHSVKYSRELGIQESKLIMETSAGKKQINVLPEEAISVSETPNSVEAIELKEEAKKPIYSIKGKKSAKLFGIFPIMIKTETKVSAETGKVISVKKPWWSFLAF